MKSRFTVFLRGLRASLAGLEAPLLVFPVAVIALVAATYLFPGGRCGAWQWWTAVAGTAAWAFLRAPDRRRGAASAGAFLAALALLWLFSNATVVEGLFDMLRYHIPAVRLLIEGWNPVWGGTSDGIRAATGIDAPSLNMLHVLSMPKGAWYFAAAAWHFAGNPHNLLFPLLPILFAAVALVLADVFRGVLPRPWRILAVALLACAMPDWANPLDAAVALCAVGLLASFWDWLRTGRLVALRIVAFSFLMAVSKPNGLVHAVLAWALAAGFGALCGRFRGGAAPFLRLLRSGIAVAVLSAVVSASPYVSSWIHFGHPFYPRWTSDEDRFPAIDLFADFLDRNEDAAAMGRAAAWVNAYVSPGLARAACCAVTGREDFFPESLTWAQQRHAPGTPTSAPVRGAFCALVLFLLLAGRREGRFAALCLLAATLAMPVEMIGYLRYVPWMAATAVFCLPALHAAAGRLRVPRRAADLCAAAAALLLLAPPSLRLAYRIDDAHAILSLEARTPPPAAVFPADIDPGCSIVPGEFEPALVANLRLLLREDSWLASAAMVPCGESGPADPDAAFARFPCNGFAVSPDCPLAAHSARHRLFSLPTARERRRATPGFVLRTYFVTLPSCCRLVLMRNKK